MIEIQDDLLKDLEAVKKISIVPSMLEIICQTTGMGFAAVARVTKNRWLACSVRDEVHFGLEEGGELKIETTLCNEIRESTRLIAIDHVSEDTEYRYHHTPKLYGFQSYISVPITLKDGTFFGTLCALDAKPAKVNNPKIIGTFTLFAELLAFHLQSIELLERSKKIQNDLKSKNLSRFNQVSGTFVDPTSQSIIPTISNIEGLLHTLSSTILQEDFDRKEASQVIELVTLAVKQLGITARKIPSFVNAGQENGREHT